MTQTTMVWEIIGIMTMIMTVSQMNRMHSSDADEYIDTDGDGLGNNSDLDDDGDGYNDTIDAFPLNPTEWLDTDFDGMAIMPIQMMMGMECLTSKR